MSLLPPQGARHPEASAKAGAFLANENVVKSAASIQLGQRRRRGTPIVGERSKMTAYWVVVALLCILLFPVVAAAIASVTRPLKGSSFMGSLLLTLIEHPSG